MAVESAIPVPENVALPPFPKSPELHLAEPFSGISDAEMFRTFRFWQKRLWLNERFRKATKGQGFMRDFDKSWRTETGIVKVKYGKSSQAETLAVVRERKVTEEELNEIRETYGERLPKNENEFFFEGFPKRKPKDGSISSAIVKHTIQLVLSPDQGNSSYLSIQRLVNRKGHDIIDSTFDDVEESDSPEGFKFVGWLAIQLV